MYSSDMVPEEYIGIFDLNPVTPIIEGYRNILYYQTPPDWMRMFESFLVAVVFLGIGNLVFGLIQKNLRRSCNMENEYAIEVEQVKKSFKINIKIKEER